VGAGDKVVVIVSRPSGRALADPAVRARTYDVTVEDGDIVVRL
jgi:nitrite reductase/ring-hydroxylating ferredoxin subunit